MTKRRAIKILRLQQEKLKTDSLRNRLWINQTCSYLKSFFGDGYEKHFGDEIRFNTSVQGNRTDAEMKVINDRYADSISQFLGNCIETIRLRGLHKNGNILSRISDAWLTVVIPALILGLLGVGTIWGKYLSDTQNFELKSENKSLKDSLAHRPLSAPQKTNTIPQNVGKDTSSTKN